MIGDDRLFGMIMLLASLLIIPPVIKDPLHPGYAVNATIQTETDVYNDRRRNSGAAGRLGQGDVVEIVMEYSERWYLIKDNETGITGWVERKNIAIPDDEPAERNVLTVFQLEEYINGENLSSETDFLIYTDLWRQRTHVFTGGLGMWQLYQTFTCATGKNETPTTRGTFKVSERGSWFYSKRLNSGGKYWVRFNETYLFHSVSMDNKRQVLDPTLGERVSSGCVRHSVEDAKWIYDNIPIGTTVVIN
jgi:hypothetical protein